MNKLFIWPLFFCVAAVVSAMPTQVPQNQCLAYKETALGWVTHLSNHTPKAEGKWAKFKFFDSGCLCKWSLRQDPEP